MSLASPGCDVVRDVVVDLLVGLRERRRSALPDDGIAAHQPQHLRGRAQALRLRGVVAALPLRIVADRVDRDAPPDAVAAGDLRRQAGERHQRVHEIRDSVSPHSQVCMPPIDVPITSRRWFTPRPSVSRRCSAVDHVAIAVARKPRAQAVARLARLAVADVVGQHDEVARDVEQLAGPEQLAGKAGADELRARSARAVHDQHGVAHDTLRVLPRRAVACGSGCAAPAASLPRRSGSCGSRSRLPCRGDWSPGADCRSVNSRRSML